MTGKGGGGEEEGLKINIDYLYSHTHTHRENYMASLGALHPHSSCYSCWNISLSPSTAGHTTIVVRFRTHNLIAVAEHLK
jgi:hypothetical protein